MYTIFNSEHGQTSLLPPDVVCGVALAPAVADGPGAAAGSAQHHVLTRLLHSGGQQRGSSY